MTIPSSAAAVRPPVGILTWGLLCLLALIFGSSFTLNRIVLFELSPLEVVTARVILGALGFIPLLLLRPASFPRRRLWLAFVLLGGVSIVLPYNLIVLGQLYIDSGTASIINAFTPFSGFILAHFLTRDEKATREKFLGLAFGILGVGILVGQGLGGGLSSQVWGGVLVLGGTLCYAVGAIAAKRLVHLSPLTLAAGTILGAAVINLFLVGGDLSFLKEAWGNPRLLLCLGLLGFSSTTCAYILFYMILRRAGAVTLLSTTLLVPVATAILSLIFLAEPLSLRKVLGMALIAFGLLRLNGLTLKRGV